MDFDFSDDQKSLKDQARQLESLVQLKPGPRRAHV